MSKYSKSSVFTVKVGQTADNTDVFGVVIPQGREVTVEAMDIYIPSGGSTAACHVELVRGDDSILCRVSTAAEGHAAAIQAASSSAQTFPLSNTVNASNKGMLKLRVDGTLGAGNINFVTLKLSGLD